MGIKWGRIGALASLFRATPILFKKLCPVEEEARPRGRASNNGRFLLYQLVRRCAMFRAHQRRLRHPRRRRHARLATLHPRGDLERTGPSRGADWMPLLVLPREPEHLNLGLNLAESLPHHGQPWWPFR